MQDEFEQRAALLGNKAVFSKPEVARILGVTDMCLWNWLRQVPPEDHPDWMRAGGTFCLMHDAAIGWCRKFAAKHPDFMARRRMSEVAL